MVRILKILGVITFLLGTSSQGWGAYESEGATQLRLNEFLKEARDRCADAPEGEPHLNNKDFGWGVSEADLDERQQKIYNGERRLYKRAFYDKEKNEFFFHFHGSDSKMKAKIPSNMIKSVTRHIEKAVTLGYVRHVNFSDMGHSHFYIPLEWYKKNISGYPVPEKNKYYEKIYAHKELKILYHVAEQVEMESKLSGDIKNQFMNWRYLNRNLVGDNRALGRVDLQKDLKGKYNTVKNLDGHWYIGEGFYLQAHKDGCFAYLHKGKKMYFDLSHYSIPWVPSGNETYISKPKHKNRFLGLGNL